MELVLNFPFYILFSHLTNLCIFKISIAECFAFLVCTRWYNPAIHRRSQIREASSSSVAIQYLDWNRGLVVSGEDDHSESRICNLQDIGGHVMKIPIIGFQVLLFMHLEVYQFHGDIICFPTFSSFCVLHVLCYNFTLI